MDGRCRGGAYHGRPMHGPTDAPEDPAAPTGSPAAPDDVLDSPTARTVFAPGRVNLIGEHTDYNEGLVLPFAIDRGISIAIRPSDDRRVEITLEATGESDGFDLDAIGPRTGRWIDYVAGTAWSMAETGLPTTGFRGRLTSDLPAGAGLSSSAALEVAAAWALSGGDRPAVDPLDLAHTTRRAENAYIGVASGLMDPVSVILGRAGHALLLDCRSLAWRHVPLPPAVDLVVIHSGMPRALATSEYNARRAECEAAVAGLAAIDPGVRSLRDVTPAALEAARDALPDVPHRRARHVVTENARVEAVVAALEAGDLETVGDAMRASHASLRDDFDVSSPALDTLVEIAGSVPGVIGARLTGAGFGGCIVALVRDGTAPALRVAVEREYPARTGLTPLVLDVRAADGAHRLG
jgi:galactokinase